MKVILLANWGLGLEILKVLHRLPNIGIELVVTRFIEDSADRWENVVHDFSLEQGCRTKRQETLSFSELKDEIERSETDLMITHAYMKILKRKVFSAPKYGSVNIHPSLLPKYRGPSPTCWVLKNKEHETGLTCHYIDEGVDTGDIVHRVRIPVKPDDTVSSIIERQKTVVEELMIESLARIMDDGFHPLPQDSRAGVYAPRPGR